MKRKPSTATIIACAALFFSLGGAGLANTVSGVSYYTVQSATQTLGPGDPTAVVHCASGDQAISGGYVGTHEIVTTESVTANPQHLTGWLVSAHLAPGQTRGAIAAEVICQR